MTVVPKMINRNTHTMLSGIWAEYFIKFKTSCNFILGCQDDFLVVGFYNLMRIQISFKRPDNTGNINHMNVSTANIKHSSIATAAKFSSASLRTSPRLKVTFFLRLFCPSRFLYGV
jgi:hypothetical protein